MTHERSPAQVAWARRLKEAEELTRELRKLDRKVWRSHGDELRFSSPFEGGFELRGQRGGGHSYSPEFETFAGCLEWIRQRKAEGA